MKLQALIRPELVFTGIHGTNRRLVLQELSRRIGGASPSLNGEMLFERLLEREELCSTGIGFGVAIPHCKVPNLRQAVLAVGISRDSVEFSSLDGKPVQTFFVLASPEGNPALHLKVLSAISRWLKADPELGIKMRDLDSGEIVAYLARAQEAEEVEV